MTSKVVACEAARKYAAAEILPTGEVGSAYLASTPAPERPSFLSAISKPIGRKRLCHELRISKHLLDMWISGERKDPIERTRDIMRVAARCYGPDLPLDIAQELVSEFGGIVVLERKSSGRESDGK